MRLGNGAVLGEARLVLLVTNHNDTAELYRLGLEQAGFNVRCFETANDAVTACGAATPAAIIMQFTPRHDPAAVGGMLRATNPGAVLIGLFSIQLPISTLSKVLHSFDDVILIPCTSEALVAHVVRLQERKRKQASA